MTLKGRAGEFMDKKENSTNHKKNEQIWLYKKPKISWGQKEQLKEKW